MGARLHDVIALTRSGPPAVVLAGGRATRIGGGDKPLRLLGDRPLLAHVLDRLAGHADPVAINANGDPARFAAFELPVLPDPVPGQPGPLAGILAALRWAGALGAPRVLTVPGDTPFIPADLAARLAGHEGTVDAAAIAGSDGRVHPTVGLWPVALATDLEAFLQSGGRKVRAWAERHDAVIVWFSGDPFANVNTPQDLAAATQRLRADSAPASG